MEETKNETVVEPQEGKLQYTPDLNNGVSTVIEKLYFRSGVQVDIVEPVTPIMVADRDGKFYEVRFAIKRNAAGFWNAERQEFSQTPDFIGDPNQEGNNRHSQEIFAREKNVMRKLLGVPQIAKFVPLLAETDPNSIATEYVVGKSLREHLRDGDLTHESRLAIVRQLLEYIYQLKKMGVYHNDLHGSNIIIMPDNRVKVIDYSDAGEQDTTLPAEDSDINRLNRHILSLLNPSANKGDYTITDQMLEKAGDLAPLIQKLPFTDNDYCELYEQFVGLYQSQ